MANSVRRRRRKLSFIFLIFCCLFLMSGCWDTREIEKRSLVSAIAVDKGSHGDMVVTVQIPVPLKIAGGSGVPGGGGGDSDSSIRIITAKGKTFQGALDAVQYKADHELFFGQTTVIAFGQLLAKNGILNTIETLRRMPQIRRLLYPIVVENGHASDILKVKTVMEKIPANFITSSIQNGVEMKNLPDFTLGRFFVGLSNISKQPAMISFRVQDRKQIVTTGVAVFREARLEGLLNRAETANLLRLTGESGGSDLTFMMYKGGEVTFHPVLKDTDFHFSLRGGIVHIVANIEVEGILKEVTFPYDLTKKSNLHRIEKRAEQLFNSQSVALVQKLQKQYNSDVLNFGARLRAFHYGIWKQVDWKKAFPKAKIKVNYKVDVRRGGMELKNYRR